MNNIKIIKEEQNKRIEINFGSPSRKDIFFLLISFGLALIFDVIIFFVSYRSFEDLFFPPARCWFCNLWPAFAFPLLAISFLFLSFAFFIIKLLENKYNLGVVAIIIKMFVYIGVIVAIIGIFATSLGIYLQKY